MSDRCHCHAEGLATFVLGALIGVTLGVLFAPAKGETTRRKFKRWAEDTYEEGKEELADRAHELKEHVLERAGELKEKFAEHAHGAKERIRSKRRQRSQE